MGKVNPGELEDIFMNKKIVVITGSPRKNGNSFAMTEAFIKAAEAKGHIVTRFDAAMRKLGGCHACETCYKTGNLKAFRPPWLRRAFNWPLIENPVCPCIAMTRC